jgi:hypothetical protein
MCLNSVSDVTAAYNAQGEVLLALGRALALVLCVALCLQ